MTIWDLHCHLSGASGSTATERMSRLMEFADRMGIERLCVYMGWPWSKDPAPEEFRRQNDQVLQVLSHYRRLFGFVYLNPKYVDESLAELDRCVKNGPMVGVKLWVALRCNAPQLDPIIKHASELKALIFQHTWLKAGGNDPGESSPFDLAELARRHPAVPLICGHTGGDWERGIRAIRSCENVSIDLAGSDPTAGLTEVAVRELGAGRVLYGSDAGGRSFASQLAKVFGAAIPESAKALILGENLKRLLMPMITAKRIEL